MRRALTLLAFFLAATGAALRAAPSPTYRIAGVVVDSVTGQPLDGAEVTIAPTTNSDEPQTLLTDSDGRFLFPNLPPAKYRLSATRRGYAPQDFNQHEGYNTAIVAGPGLDSEHIRFRLTPGAVLTGVVTDEYGDPVRDARVLLFRQSVFEGSRALRPFIQATTDDQGRYRAAHLLPGAYAVAVSARPWYSASSFQFAGGLRRLADSSDDSAGQFIASTQLVESPQPASVSPLLDVVYPVTFFPGTARLTDAARLSLAAGAAETADFQLHAVPSLHLRVSVPVEPPLTVTSRDDDGQETTSQVESPAAVYASLRIGDAYTEQLQARSTDIAPGVIELSGLPPGEINLVSTSFLSDQNEQKYVSRSKTLDLTGDTAIDLNPQGAPAKVSGVVQSGQFLAAASADESSPPDQTSVQAPSTLSISFRSVASGETYDAPVSSKGAFSFSGSLLPAGAYEVDLLSPGNLRVSSVEATGAAVSGRTVELPADHPVSLVVHTMEPKCALSGFALKNRKPVSGAMVLLVPQDSGSGAPRYYRDQSDSDGSFLIGGLFPGRYTLLAIENGWDLEWADPAVLLRYLPAGQPVAIAPAASVRLNAKVQD
jgi:carboxypeptidase family protein